MTPSRPTPAAPTRRRLRLARLSAWFGVAVLTSSLVITGVALRSHAGDERRSASTTAPPPSDLVAVAIGYVDVEHGVTPVAPVQTARVVRIDAQEGVAVAAHKPLLQLDDTAARLQADEARAGVAAAQVRLEQAKQLKTEYDQQIKAQQAAIDAAAASVKAAEAQYKQTQRRLGSKAASEEDVDTAKQLLAKTQASQRSEEARLAALQAHNPDFDVRLAREDLVAKQAALKRAEQAVDEYALRAPFAGTPLRILASVGEVIGPQGQQPAVWFCPPGPRIIRAEVEQEFASRVDSIKNQPVRIEDDSTGAGNWVGHVQRIGDWYSQRRSVLHEPLQFNDVRTLECIVTLDPEKDHQPQLRIGQRVRVNFLKSSEGK